MAHHDNRSGKFIDRLCERCAAIDVEMVGRLVEDDQLRPEEGRKSEQQPRLLAAGEIFHRRVGGGPEKPIWPARARTFASGVSGRSLRMWV